MNRPPPLLLPALLPLSWLYRGAVALRNGAYDRGLLPSGALEHPVLSVGNLSVGGSGKTPFTEACARILLEQGHTPAVLSRGYGRVADDPVLVSRGEGPLVDWSRGGDEPVLLARRVDGLVVAVAADRRAAGRLVQAAAPEVDVFLLDDGFQHRRLRRDLDLVLAPSREPFGNGRLLPAGPLREPLGSLARADALVVTGGPAPEGLASRAAEAAGKQVPILEARLRVRRLVDLAGAPAGAAESLRGERIAAFAGIARPDGFFATLRGLEARIVLRRVFRDHHPYRREELEELHRDARRAGAARLVTTEKDSVRLVGFPVPATPPHVVALSVELVPHDPRLLAELITRPLEG